MKWNAEKLFVGIYQNLNPGKTGLLLLGLVLDECNLTVYGTKIVNISIFAHSLEMEEERVYNEMSSFHNVAGGGSAAAGTLAAAGAVHAASVHRTRTVSSPVPVNVSF